MSDLTGIQESEVTPDMERKIAESRAERDLFERKHHCDVHGKPFVPTDEERAILDRLEAQVPKPVSKEDKARWNRHEQAREMERQLETTSMFGDPDGERRVRARIAELKAS